MKVRIYCPPAQHKLVLFERGLKAHGVEDVAYLRRGQYEPADLAVHWAHKSPNIQNAQRARGLDYMVMELAYFRSRTEYISLGFNGLNGHAEFYNRGCSGDRWAKHGVELKPWKTGGDYVLLLGQVLGDASLATCRHYIAFLKDALERLKCYGLPVKFRPHPKGKTPPINADIAGGSLEDALSKAAVAVSWNSNSLVDAVIAGVPTIACDRGSMAWDVSAHGIGAEVIRPDRTQWSHNLAYTQWTGREVESGEAWAHLKQRHDGRPIEPMPEPERHGPVPDRSELLALTPAERRRAERLLGLRA